MVNNTAPAKANALAPQKENAEKFSAYIGRADIRVWLNNVLGNQSAAEKFVANISSTLAAQPALQKCTSASIVSAALLANSLKLSMSPSLGYCYLVPFKQKAKHDKGGVLLSPEKELATFILGYKGYIQLAIRTGVYKHINVLPIKECERPIWNKKTEELALEVITDDTVLENSPTAGYYAYFETLNGFTKAIYWTKEKMQIHADRYSKAYSLEEDKKLKAGQVPEKDLWKYSSYWYSSFDSMAMKTLIRQLLGTWGPVSTDIEKAIINDSDFKDTEFFADESGAESPAQPQIAAESREDDEPTDEDRQEALSAGAADFDLFAQGQAEI